MPRARRPSSAEDGAGQHVPNLPGWYLWPMAAPLAVILVAGLRSYSRIMIAALAAIDLYSAAATLYEARTGKPWIQPRAGENAVELQRRVGMGHSVDPTLKPPALGSWFARALSTEPQKRFATAREMRRAFKQGTWAAPAVAETA